MTTITIFPEYFGTFLISSSILKRFAVTTSPSAPPAGVDPVQPMASTCSGLRIGSSNSPCAVPRVQPRQSWYFSMCTFSRPMAFILATPHCSAFLSAGVPVTRAPISSLSSVRYWKACESIIPSPAIFTSAGFVPSSSGPFGAGRLSARTIHAPLTELPSITTAALAKTPRIRFLLAPFAHINSTTLSNAPAAIQFLRTCLSLLSYEISILNPLSSSLQALRAYRAVHIRQRGRSHLFTHLRPRPTLPARPSCDFISASIRSRAHSQYVVSLSPLFFLSHKRSKLGKSQKRNPAQWLRLLPNPHTPL